MSLVALYYCCCFQSVGELVTHHRPADLLQNIGKGPEIAAALGALDIFSLIYTSERETKHLMLQDYSPHVSSC